MNFLSKLSKKILNFSILVFLSINCTQCNHHNHHVPQASEHNPPNHYLLADRNTLLMRGYSTSFTDGFLDGCRSGQYAAGDLSSFYINDQEHAKLNPEYTTGWEQGNNFCYTQMRDLIKHNGSDNPYVYHSKEAIEQEKQRIWAELKK